MCNLLKKDDNVKRERSPFIVLNVASMAMMEESAVLSCGGVTQAVYVEREDENIVAYRSMVYPVSAEQMKYCFEVLAGAPKRCNGRLDVYLLAGRHFFLRYRLDPEEDWADQLKECCTTFSEILSRLEEP